MKRLIPLFLFLILLLAACSSRSAYDCSINGITYTVDPAARTVTDGTHTYSYATSGSRTTITYPDGATYYFVRNDGSTYSGHSQDYDPDRYVSGDILKTVLADALPPTPAFVPGMFFAALLVLLICAIMIFLPGVAIAMRHRWIFPNAAPSRAAILCCRICGLVCSIGGIYLLILSFFGGKL